jgi:hypothetical protein
VSGQEILPVVNAERCRTRQIVRRTFAMDEEPRPISQHLRSEEIVDVDVPITIEAGRNQEPRVVVEQHISGFMESLNVLQDLSTFRFLRSVLLFFGQVLAQELLAARLHLEQYAQFADHSGSPALPWRHGGFHRRCLDGHHTFSFGTAGSRPHCLPDRLERLPASS